MILSAYKELEGRASHWKPGRGAKTEIVEQAVEKQHGDFAIGEIMRECLGVSRPMIRVVLEGLRRRHLVKVLGTGRAAKWRKT